MYSCNEVDLELFPQVLKQTAYLNTLKHLYYIDYWGYTARQQTLLLATYLYSFTQGAFSI